MKLIDKVKIGDLYYTVHNGAIFTEEQRKQAMREDLDKLKNSKFESEFVKGMVSDLIKIYKSELGE